MRVLSALFACATLVFASSAAVTAETYTESFECTFESGNEKRPTPVRVLFSVDQNTRSALLHEVEIPEIYTVKRAAEIERNSYRVLSISWPGDAYTFAGTNRGTRIGDVSTKIIDLHLVDFSLFLDRRNMKAQVRSISSRNDNLKSSAKGRCAPVQLAK